MTHTNALAAEKSPYLRQHAHNPVDWLPWGEVAFEKARQEDKPIFLSIGYSTCHWCHVMAHESFEDPATAEVLNGNFVPVKIDREERPDIDRVYMLFVQASTGSGGWPMSVWLTPELKPFYGGTYFPPDNRYGRPGFRTLLQHLATAWHDDRQRVLESSASVTEQLRSFSGLGKPAVALNRTLVDSGYWQFRRSYDARYGGFGQAPKFPRPAVLIYLLREYASTGNSEALDMVTHTLREMAAGGMHDQLGGGFHRYSVDERWFVPHFEKMLYDQAQLAVAYLEAFQATGEAFFADVVHDILRYVLRDLQSPEKAFYSAEDADSQDPEDDTKHGEGAFYIWRQAEIETLLGMENARPFCEAYGVRPSGNVEMDPQGEFTGRNILYQALRGVSAAGLEASKLKLFGVREQRPRPHLDRKVLTAWNGLMISALARAGAVLQDREFLEAARGAANFLLRTMYDPASGTLKRRYCDGEAAVAAFADDYVFLAAGLVDLFEASGEAHHLQFAIDLCTRGLTPFRDEEGGWFSTITGASDVLLRLKDDYDGAEPSANSMAADLLLRLGHLTARPELEAEGRRALEWLSPRLAAQPSMSPLGLAAAMRSFAPPAQVVIRCETAGDGERTLAWQRLQAFDPFVSVLLLTDAACDALRTDAPFLAGLVRQGRITVYECRDFVCSLPQVLGKGSGN